MEEVLKPTRELIDGKWHRVDVSSSGFRLVFARPDDQLPNHDGVNFFSPLRVEEGVHWSPNRVWSCKHYCGKCRKIMDRFGFTAEYCPRCGAGIAHWMWTMGTIKWRPETWSEELPDQLPIFSDGASAEHGFVFASVERKALSGATASDPTLNGSD